MKSKFLLIAWLIVVGAIVFLAVYFLGQGTGDVPGTSGSGNSAVVQPVPDRPGDDSGDRPRVGDRPTGVKRMTPKVIGRVVNVEGDPVGGVRLSVSLPASAPKSPATANEQDIRFINEVIYIDPLEWDAPRPLRSFVDTLDDSLPERAAADVLATDSTAPNGTFSIDIPRHVGLGPFRISAESGVGKAIVTGVRPGVEIEITVGPVATAEGFVYTGNENVGIEGAVIVLDDGESRFVGRSGPGGEFRIEGVSPGRYSLSAGAPRQPPLLAQETVVKAGEPISIRLPRGTILRVAAVFEPEDGPDRPLANVEIVALEQDSFTYVTAKTDANGIADFAAMPPGTYLINGRVDGAVSFGEEIEDVTGNQLLQDVELLFEPAILTELTVIDTEGAAVPGMVFFTSNSDEEYDALRSIQVKGQTDQNGRFDFPFEFEGPRAQIFGFKAGFAMVRVYPDAHDDGIPMTLVARPAYRVHGRVQTPDGRAIPDALVLIEVEPDESVDPDDFEDYVIQVRSKADGSYDFPYVPKGAIWVSAEIEDEDYWSDDLEVELVDGKNEYRVDIEIELD